MTTERMGAVVRKTGPGGRDYVWEPTGEKFPSVTTLISGLDKPAIPYWAADETAAEAYDRFHILAAYHRDDDRDGAIEWLKRSPWKKREKSAETGTAVHAHIEAAVTGAQVAPPSKEDEPFLRSFLRFVEDHDPEFMMAEAPVFNRTERYAGTLDTVLNLRAGRYAGGPVLCDYKTHGKSLAYLAEKRKPGPPYPEIGLQLAAYRHAEFVGLADGSEQPMPEVVGGLAIILFPDGYRLVPVECGDLVFEAFLYAREAYRWKAVTSRTVLGDAVTVAVTP